MEVGTRVVTKHGAGTIKFSGETKFASGDWLGVELDEATGKNQGAVQGVQYFETSANRGLFVKPNQVQVEKPKNPVRRSIIPPKTSGLRAPNTRQPLSARQSLAGTPGSKKSSAPGSGASTPKNPTPKGTSSLSRQGSTLRSASPAPQISENEAKSETEPENANSSIVQPSEPPRVIHIESGFSQTEIHALKTQVKDWKSRCELIQAKRKTDFEKIRDAEKIRIKLEHVMAERERLTASVKKLNDEVDEKTKMLEQITDDHADVSDTIENAILEKEIAESKAEELEIELENLKEKFEEIETDYEILKAEVEEHGLEGAAGSFSNKSMEEENIKLKQTLVALKTSQNQEKLETNQIKTQLSQIQKDLSKKTEKIQLLQDENDANRRKIRDLTEQVDASADAHDIAERLTEKILDEEEKNREIEDKNDELEQMAELNDQLLEEAKDVELQLREELDMEVNKYSQLNMEMDSMKVQALDYHEQIEKYRAYVADKKEEERLKDNQNDGESPDVEQLNERDEQLKVQKQLLESTTAKTALELELRKLETEQLESFSEWLKLFVPNAAQTDVNVLKLILLSNRLSRKSKILTRLLRTKNVEKTEIGRDMIWLCSLLSNVCNILDQLLNECDQSTWIKFGNLLNEAIPHERCLNLPLELIIDVSKQDAAEKASQAPLEPIRRAIRYFSQVLQVNEKNFKINGNSRWLKRFLTRCEALSLYPVENGSEESVNVTLNASIDSQNEYSDVFQKYIRSIKRKMPAPEGSATCADLSIQNFEKYEEILDEVITDTEVAQPLNLTNLIDALKTLNESLQSGVCDVSEKSQKPSKITQRATNFHENYELNHKKTGEVGVLQKDLLNQKLLIKSLESDQELKKVKIDLLESQQQKSKMNAGANERELMEKIEVLEAKYKKDLVEKDKALDMLHAEVEKLESGKVKSGMLKGRTSLGVNLGGNLGISDLKSENSEKVAEIVGNSSVEQMGIKVLALEIALKNSFKEKHQLRAQSMLEKLRGMGKLELHPRLRDSSVGLRESRVLTLQSEFIDTITLPTVIRFDENGYLPSVERDSDNVRDLKLSNIKKSINQIMDECTMIHVQ